MEERRGRDTVVLGIFFRLLPVQIFLMVLSSVNTIIDGTFASNFIGLRAMDAIGLFGPVNSLVGAVNAVLLGGSQILCGRFLGENQVKKTNGVFSLDMIVITGISLAFTLVSLFFSMPLAHLLGSSGEVAEELGVYIVGMSFGYLPQMISFQLSSFLQMDHGQKRTYVGMAAMMVSNTVLDWLLIVVLDMGMLGLGLASSISDVIFLLTLVPHYLKKRSSIKFDRKAVVWKDLVNVLIIGFPGAIVSFCLTVRWTIYNYVLTRFGGEGALGAYSAFSALGCFFFAISSGIGSTTRLMTSIYLGEKDRTSLMETLRLGLYKGLGMVTAFAVLIFLLAEPLTRIYFRDPTLPEYRLTIALFRINAISMPLSEIFVVFQNYYQSKGEMKFVHILSVTDGLVASGLSALVLTPLFGAMGCWWSLVVNGVISLVLINCISISRMRRLPRSLEDLVCLSSDFGVPDDCRLDVYALGIEDVENISQSVIDFFRGHGADRKKSFFAGLCLEEMAGNVVEHGFTKDRGRHSIDIRVIYTEDELTLRISDNCIPFNPKERAQLFKHEDPTKNIGLKLVARIAKDMQYQNILGLNVLTITV